MELWVISQILCFNCISTPSSSDVRGLLNYLHWSAFIVYWVVVQVCLLWTWQLKSLFCIRDEIKVFANVSGYSLNMSCHSHCLYLFIFFITDWIKGLYRHGVWWCPLTVTLTPNSSFEVMKTELLCSINLLPGQVVAILMHGPVKIGKQCEDIVLLFTVLSLQWGRRVCKNMYEHVNLKYVKR